MNFQYPLQWLPQQPRTKRPQRARFGKHSISVASNYLVDELRLLGGKDCIISCDLQQTLNKKGFYSNQRVEDSGVVIYFKLKDQSKAMACDLWDLPEHNLWALMLSIKAIRGLERWGGSEFLDGLFTGFKALPSPGNTTITTKRYFDEVQGLNGLKFAYRELVKKLHPDMGGTTKEFQEMQIQYNQKKESLQ